VTLNGKYVLYCWKDASFGAQCKNLNEDRPILSVAIMLANDSSFWKYKVYAELRILAGVPQGRSVEWRWWLSSISSDFDGYFFGNFRNKARNIIWRCATSCRPVIDGKNEWPWMTFSGYFMSKSVFGQHFLTQNVWLSKIIPWKVTKSHTVSGRNVGQWFWFIAIWIIFRCSKVFLRLLLSNQNGVVEIDEFAVFPMPYLRKFRK